jgi:hypothetical protein
MGSFTSSSCRVTYEECAVPAQLVTAVVLLLKSGQFLLHL